VQLVVVAEVARLHAGGLEALDPVRRTLQALGQLLQLDRWMATMPSRSRLSISGCSNVMALISTPPLL
jgi:hypothetical protein